MIKKRLPVIIDLPADCEYSIDGGDSWTAVPANTRTEVFEEDSGVTVRSQNEIDFIDGTKNEFNTRLYDYINIRNGKSLKSLDRLFEYAIVDKVRVQNVDAVETLDKTFKNLICDTLFVDDVPLATTAEEMFSGTKANIVSKISLSNKDAIMKSVKGMFEDSKINIVGDVELLSKAVSSSEKMFSNAKIDFFPYVKMNLSTTEDEAGGYEFRQAGMFSSLKTPYLLSGHIYMVPGDETTSAAASSALLGYDNGQSGYGFMENSTAIFSGLTIMYDNENEPVAERLFTGSQNLRAPFSMLVNRSKAFVAEDKLDQAIDGTLIDDKVNNPELMSIDGGYIGVYDWIEDIVILEQSSCKYLIDLDYLNVVGGKALFKPTTSDIAVEAVRLERYDEITETVNVDLSSKKTDWKARAQNGYTVVGISDTEFATSHDDEDYVASFSCDDENKQDIYMSADGLTAYIVSGEQYDQDAAGNQTKNAKISFYDFETGDSLGSEEYTLPSNTSVRGGYKPYSDSNTILLLNSFDPDTGDELNSIVISYKDGVEVTRKELDMKADVLAKYYWEENEFICANTEDGSYVRCFGK